MGRPGLLLVESTTEGTTEEAEGGSGRDEEDGGATSTDCLIRAADALGVKLFPPSASTEEVEGAEGVLGGARGLAGPLIRVQDSL